MTFLPVDLQVQRLPNLTVSAMSHVSHHVFVLTISQGWSSLRAKYSHWRCQCTDNSASLNSSSLTASHSHNSTECFPKRRLPERGNSYFALYEWTSKEASVGNRNQLGTMNVQQPPSKVLNHDKTIWKYLSIYRLRMASTYPIHILFLPGHPLMREPCRTYVPWNQINLNNIQLSDNATIWWGCVLIDIPITWYS